MDAALVALQYPLEQVSGACGGRPEVFAGIGLDVNAPPTRVALDAEIERLRRELADTDRELPELKAEDGSRRSSGQRPT